jgi:hypothetical protein
VKTQNHLRAIATEVMPAASAILTEAVGAGLTIMDPVDRGSFCTISTDTRW